MGSIATTIIMNRLIILVSLFAVGLASPAGWNEGNLKCRWVYDPQYKTEYETVNTPSCTTTHEQECTTEYTTEYRTECSPTVRTEYRQECNTKYDQQCSTSYETSYR